VFCILYRIQKDSDACGLGSIFSDPPPKTEDVSRAAVWLQGLYNKTGCAESKHSFG
jgi:hypothetical protein